MAIACRNDTRRVTLIAAPLFAAAFLVEAASHLADPHVRMLVQPLISALFCIGVRAFGRPLLERLPYPEVVLLLLWALVMWAIGLHATSVHESTRASTLVMLAVAAVGSATLIMPVAAAILAIGGAAATYVYMQSVYFGMLATPAPVLVLLVVIIIYRSRRSAIRSVEELRARVAWDQEQLEEVNEQLRALSVTDPLTGALNRRGFADRLEADLAGAARSSQPLSVLFLDVDHFKDYNDSFGHPAGDVALIELSRALRSCCRGGDSVGRYGGEEFTLILPATDAAGCQHMAERARRAVATVQGLARPITVSIGAATVQPKTMSYSVDLVAALIAAADDALYRAKEGGRDRAEFAVLPTPEGLQAYGAQQFGSLT